MEFVDEARPQNSIEQFVPNRRTIHTRYGFDVHLERRDPYGFVHVVWNKGPAPAALSGAYSDFDKARLAVTIYLESETFNKVVDAPMNFEKAKYKRMPKES